jgi:protein-S-isoprenylcysteine O-methyltransferase Ste14
MTARMPAWIPAENATVAVRVPVETEAARAKREAAKARSAVASNVPLVTHGRPPWRNARAASMSWTLILFDPPPFMHTRPDAHVLELKIPPVALVVIVAVAMWLGAAYVPGFHFRFPLQSIAALVIGLAGIITCTLGFLEFKRAKTTVNPTKPQSSSSLVTSGIYRHTRNPMYLGFLLILAGWAAFTATTLSFFGLPAFVFYMNQFQIKPEERALESLFGEEFTEYCFIVRRWIWCLFEMTTIKEQIMEYLIGLFLALGISIGATAIGFDRDRSFYPTILIVIAFLYGLFAMIAGSTHALLGEALPMVLFVTAAGIGFKKKLWWVVAGLVAHGVFDFFHRDLISNPGVPVWWPGFCLTYDVTAGAYLAYLLKRAKPAL